MPIMSERYDGISIAILVLLLFISLVVGAYLITFTYKFFKTRLLKELNKEKSSWLETDREPLIPGNISTQTIQPSPNYKNSFKAFEADDDDTSDDDHDFKERDFTKLGRIIFVMRYHKKRHELMIRLVQIEGVPASYGIYSPNAAYVDVQLKYVGNPSTSNTTVQKPPTLDICLQEVYYFIISVQQMMSHSVVFQINTFDEEYHRYVSGIVEMNLYDEMGDDILTGSEVVFVKDIMEPYKVVREEENRDIKKDSMQRLTRQSSAESSNMSWEPESRDLISLSTNSLYIPVESNISVQQITDMKRYHSVGYLPTYEWTVKDIPLDDDNISENNDVNSFKDNILNSGDMTLSPTKTINPITPESYYHIVPMTPLCKEERDSKKTRQVMMKKKKVTPRKKSRMSSITRHFPTNRKKDKSYKHRFHKRTLSWPLLSSPEIVTDNEFSYDI